MGSILEKTFLYFYQFIISFGVDGISLFLLLLTTFLIPLCLLTSYKYNLIFVKEYCLCLLCSILVIYYDVGTTNFNIVSKSQINIEKELILWFFMYIAFSIKIPTVPMHI